MKRRVAEFLTSAPCPACHGKRLKPEALSVTFERLDIADFSQLPLHELMSLIEAAVTEAGDATNDTEDGSRSSGEALEEALRREADEQRVAAGGSAHSTAP